MLLIQHLSLALLPNIVEKDPLLYLTTKKMDQANIKTNKKTKKPLKQCYLSTSELIYYLQLF